MKKLKPNDFWMSDAVTLKEHFSDLMDGLCKANDRRFQDLEEKLNLRFNEFNKATLLATDNLKVRLDGLNEWRMQNKDERNQFITKDAYEAKHQLIENKIETFQKFMYIVMGVVLTAEFIFKFLIK
ncbi:MAG: hypothetical protein WC549_00560 [Actinomycetota bacterium]